MSYYRRPYYEPESKPIINPYKVAAEMMKKEKEPIEDSSDSSNSSNDWSSSESSSCSDDSSESEEESVDFCHVSDYGNDHYERRRGFNRSDCSDYYEYSEEEEEEEEEEDIYDNEEDADNNESVDEFDWNFSIITFIVIITVIGLGALVLFPSLRSSEVQEMMEPLDEHIKPVHELKSRVSDFFTTIGKGLTEEQLLEAEKQTRLEPMPTQVPIVITGQLSEKDKKRQDEFTAYGSRLREIANKYYAGLEAKNAEKKRRQMDAESEMSEYWRVKFEETKKEVERLKVIKESKQKSLEATRAKRTAILENLQKKQNHIDQKVGEFPKSFRSNLDEIDTLTKQAYTLSTKISITNNLTADLKLRSGYITKIIDHIKIKCPNHARIKSFLQGMKSATFGFAADAVDSIFNFTKKSVEDNLCSQNFNPRNTDEMQRYFKDYKEGIVSAVELTLPNFNSDSEDIGTSTNLAQILEELDSQMFILHTRNNGFLNQLKTFLENIDSNFTFFGYLNQLKKNVSVMEVITQSTKVINQRLEVSNGYKLKKYEKNIDLKLLKAWHQRMLLPFLTHHKAVEFNQIRMHEQALFEKYSNNHRSWLDLITKRNRLTDSELLSLLNSDAKIKMKPSTFPYKYEFERLIEDYFMLKISNSTEELKIVSDLSLFFHIVKYRKEFARDNIISIVFLYSQFTRLSFEDQEYYMEHWPSYTNQLDLKTRMSSANRKLYSI
jgi:hypothetical protein